MKPRRKSGRRKGEYRCFEGAGAYPPLEAAKDLDRLFPVRFRHGSKSKEGGGKNGAHHKICQIPSKKT